MASDAAALGALWMDMSRKQEPLGEEWVLADGAAERFARGIQAAVGNPRCLYLVAEIPGAEDGAPGVAGFLQASVKLRSSMYRESVVGEIQAVSVAPDVAGRGVGTALVEAAMEWFRKRGIAHVEAAVSAENAPARSFWRSMGFRDSAVICWREVPAASTPPAPAGGTLESGAPLPGSSGPPPGSAGP